MFILTDEYRKECIVLLEKEISSNEDKKNSAFAELNSGTLSFNEMSQVSEIVKGVQGDVPGIVLGSDKLIKITKLFEQFLVDIDYKGIPVSIANVTPDNRVGNLSINVPITDTVTIVYSKEITAFSGQLYEAELSNTYLSGLKAKLLKGAPGAQCILNEEERDKILELEKEVVDSQVEHRGPSTLFKRAYNEDGITFMVGEEKIFVPAKNCSRLDIGNDKFVRFPILNFIDERLRSDQLEATQYPNLSSMAQWIKKNVEGVKRLGQGSIYGIVKLNYMFDGFDVIIDGPYPILYVGHKWAAPSALNIKDLTVEVTDIKLDLNHITYLKGE